MFLHILTAHELHTPRHALSARTKWTIIRKMAIAVTLHWLNDLGCLVTPIFLSLGRFLYRFSMFCKKWKNLSSGSLNLLQNAPSYSIHLTSFLAVWQFQMPLKGLRLVKMTAIFEIINTTDSLIQNIIRIVCLCWLILDILS